MCVSSTASSSSSSSAAATASASSTTDNLFEDSGRVATLFLLLLEPTQIDTRVLCPTQDTHDFVFRKDAPLRPLFSTNYLCLGLLRSLGPFPILLLGSL